MRLCASWVEVARVAVARGPAGERARLLRVVELGARSRHALRVALVGHFLRSAMRRSCGSAGGQATGCVAGRSRCSVSMQGGCRSMCTSRVCSAVSGAVAAAPAAPASRPGCTVPPAGPAPASWRCQSPVRPLRTHRRGMQGEPTPRLGGRARASGSSCARTVGLSTNESRGLERGGRSADDNQCCLLPLSSQSVRKTRTLRPTPPTPNTVNTSCPVPFT